MGPLSTVSELDNGPVTTLYSLYRNMSGGASSTIGQTLTLSCRTECGSVMDFLGSISLSILNIIGASTSGSSIVSEPPSRGLSKGEGVAGVVSTNGFGGGTINGKAVFLVNFRKARERVGCEVRPSYRVGVNEKVSTSVHVSNSLGVDELRYDLVCGSSGGAIFVRSRSDGKAFFYSNGELRPSVVCRLGRPFCLSCPGGVFELDVSGWKRRRVSSCTRFSLDSTTRSGICSTIARGVTRC